MDEHLVNLKGENKKFNLWLKSPLRYRGEKNTFDSNYLCWYLEEHKDLLKYGSSIPKNQWYYFMHIYYRCWLMVLPIYIQNETSYKIIRNISPNVESTYYNIEFGHQFSSIKGVFCLFLYWERKSENVPVEQWLKSI